MLLWFNCELAHFTNHVWIYSAVQTKFWRLESADYEVGVEHLKCYLNNITKQAYVTGIVAVWIFLCASSVFTSHVLISATLEFGTPYVLVGWMQIWGIGIGYSTLCLSLCFLLQLKPTSDPARLHSRPHGGTVAIGEECGHNCSQGFSLIFDCVASLSWLH
jgi:hypothetical protein